jgi:uncharacterized membrane protein YedE/YeeE
MKVVTALLAGLLFGAGLTISGMVNPAVVLGFLDVAGTWNPALLLVMVGALAVALPGYWLLRGRKPLFAEKQLVPTRRDIDTSLIVGSLIFGVGWGLAGICPGPALTMFGIRPDMAFIFVFAMTVGMMLSRFADVWMPGSGAPDQHQ